MEHIDKQIGLITDLERDGHDATVAREFLAALEDTQQLHEHHRQHVLRELAE